LSQTSGFQSGEHDGLQALWEDGDRAFFRLRRSGTDGKVRSVLAVRPVAERPHPTVTDRLTHEYGLRDELDSAWALRPLELVSEGGRSMLVLEDSGGEPLERQLHAPMELRTFLGLAVQITAALGKVHQHGLVHKDIKPRNIIVNRVAGDVKLTGFGIASRLPRGRQSPEPPETIAGTLAYMAPEQTGRMNRSVDSRSDLYALGGTFYQMLTGSLPFSASDPMEWVHCQIARRPTTPAERLKDVPGVVSKIIMKLLAKTAEDRYQTAAGLECDLRRCLAARKAQRWIEEFPLGAQDVPDRLVIPEKLYGREREIETLRAAFDRIVESGTAELVLVSGYSGIGKSSVVNELHKALVLPRGLFASSKFDQYKRDIPFATLAQAFQRLIRPLLGKDEAELAPWRDALLEALGPSARLMVDVVPELKLIIGDQPAVHELSPQAAQWRFRLLFRRFIAVFARPEHPLALFLDDLQWIDAATLDLLEDLLTRSDVTHLMLIGAYRDNEVDPTHPLRRRLDAIRTGGGKVAEITLAPLAREHLGELIADALRCEPAQAAPLAQLVHGKTGGNPFFAIQFISALADEGMLSFDYDTARWSWDIKRIHAQAYTDNVVDLVVGKLARLPAETQEALQQLACLGNCSESTTVSIVLGAPEEQVHAALWPAVAQELVERLPDAYRFVHGRVQEAAYSLIPKQQRVEAHLRIGRLLLAHTPAEKQDEAVFDIINHLNRGAALVTSRDEREQLAGLNLTAGRRAKASTAYTSALNYLAAGSALLPADCWERRHPLAFSLEFHRAECGFVTGAVRDAEQRLSALAERCASASEHAAVARLRVDLYMALSQPDRAVSVGLGYLRRLGIHWPAHPDDDEVRRQYERVWSRLGSRAIEELFDLPLMTDAGALATLDLLTAFMPAAFFTDANLRSLVVIKAVDLSLEWGHSDASCVPYVMFGAIAGARFSDYQAGIRFSNIGIELVERRGLSRVQARTYLNYGNLVLTWTKHLRHARDAFRRAFEIANGSGDVTFASFSCSSLNVNFLAAGDPLSEAQREAEYGLQFAEKAHFALLVDIMMPQVGLIRTLRGLTQRFGTFDDGQFDELAFERRLSADPAFALPESWYWIRKLQARFFCGEYALAVDAASKARRLPWSPPQLFETAEYEFYAALSHASCWDSAPTDQRQQHRLALSAHHGQLEVWAQNCPDNFRDRETLVGAEIARIEGRDVDAMRLYDQAISAARASGFVHNEALANEMAARYYAGRGFEKIANAYLRDARYCYVRWGADGKVRQLDEMYPHLKEADPAFVPAGAIGTSVEHLDLATVIKVSQAVSGEIVLERLLDTLMRTAMAQAGAERAVLILASEAEPRIAAEATTSGDTVTVHLCDEPVTSTVLPESVLRYILRSHESVILDDASAQSPIAADPYVRERQIRSVLCLPLLNRAKLIGVLYLENNLAPRVFSPARISVLKLLASQAAISLENTHLYRDLAEREAKIRRLVDANIIGIFVSDIQGQVIEANDAFLHMVGYGREDLASERVNRVNLTPPEWYDRDVRTAEEMKATGTVQPFEKEYFHKNGSRIPVLIGVTAFDERRTQVVGFVLDLSGRKRAEAEARDSERRYREVQAELAHAGRVATMGQLTASIAHEVKQPIAGSVTNVQAALNWLNHSTPNLEEARQALACAVNDGIRAGEVIDRIRELVRKTPPRKDRLEINGAIREVIELIRGEAVKNRVSVQMQLAEGLPLIEADRVQLQQAILNLIINAIQAMSVTSDGLRELLIRTGKADAGGVLVTVHDSGPGLEPGTLEHFFEPFHTTKPDGLGLGLSICRSIIEAHGGRLWASANAHRGANFQFTVPACSDRAS
jgi:PAS domain S-box-containing protein